MKTFVGIALKYLVLMNLVLGLIPIKPAAAACCSGFLSSAVPFYGALCRVTGISQ